MNFPVLSRGLPILMLMLAACTPAGPSAMPTQPPATVVPAVAPTTVPTAAPTLVPTAIPTQASTPTSVAESLSFAARTYQDETAGIAFDYPADWTLDPSSQVGVRGAQTLLFSPGTTLETLADGGARVAVIVYVWDPKNDIDAYVTQRKTAWDASGFAVSEEDQWQLADGRVVYRFTVRTPNEPTFYLLTTAGEDYLQIAGDGDQALIQEIAHTLRPLP